MVRTHKIRLNPTPEQRRYFMRASGVARFAWNWALADYKATKDRGGTQDWNDAGRRFRRLKYTDFQFVNEVGSKISEKAMRDLRIAISSYYALKKKGASTRFPSNRSRSKSIGGFVIGTSELNPKFGTFRIRIPILGWVNMAESLRFQGKVCTARVIENRGNWYVVAAVEIDAPPSTAEGSIGIDFGLKTFATLSNGERCETQAAYRKGERKLRSLQRALARKKNGSANRGKAKAKIARHNRRIYDQRKDYHHKVTTNIASRFNVVCVEDLNLQGMCRMMFSKSVTDAGIGLAVKMLEYKANTLQKVSRWFPSSKRCRHCGSINAELKLSDRTWTCACGAEHDRDLNAAINIELEGLRLLAGSGHLGVTPVEFATSTQRFGGEQVADCEAGTLLLQG